MGDLKLTSASGSVTLSPENVAGTTTITVPSSTATLLTTSLSNLSATGEQKVAQAWVNFNGTGTVAIRDSNGVSSITDVDVGRYKVNFTTSMSNKDYVISYLAQTESAWNDIGTTADYGNNNVSYAYLIHRENSVLTDSSMNLVTVFGDPS